MSNVIDHGKNPLFERVCFFQNRDIVSAAHFCTFAAGVVTLHHALATVDGYAPSEEPMGRSCWCSGRLLHGKGIDGETIQIAHMI